MSTSRSTHHAALYALLGALAVAGVLRVGAQASHESGADFYQFWLVSKCLAESRVSPPRALYTPEKARELGELGFTWASAPTATPRHKRAAAWFRTLQPMATPLFYTAMRPFAALPYEAAQHTFAWVSLAAWLAALLWLARRTGSSWSVALTLAAFATLLFEPMASELRAANVNRLLFAALVFALALSARARAARTTPGQRALHLASGAWQGLLLTYKPVVGPLLAANWLFKLARRRVQESVFEALGTALGIALGIGIGALAMEGLGAWDAWRLGWQTLVPPETLSLALGNYGPHALLEHALGNGAPVRPWLFALAALLLLVPLARVVVSARREPRPPEGPPNGLDASATLVSQDALAMSLGFALLVTASSLVWLHYQVLALIPLVAAAPTLARPGSRVQLTAWLAALLCVALEPLRPLLGAPSAVTFALVLVVGDALLAGVTVAALWRDTR